MKSRLQLFFTLCLTVFAMTQVQAQERTYSGVVKGSDGKPVAGASVVVIGTSAGTSTGHNGKYTIKARQGSKITYSYLGMKPVTVTTAANTIINVILENDEQALDDVVIIAYGTTKKKDLTGSISTIDSKQISAQSNSTLTKTLEGAVPGIQVSSVDGQPGYDMGIRIRGIGSATQNNSNALVVIDGVPATAGFNVLSTMNPKDIESITVLKDAASTALWGSRGANGVIMVTSKKGEKGKTKINLDSKWGVNMIGNNQPKLIRNVDDNYEMMWESIYNSVRYGSTEKYQTNFRNPNMSDEDASLFASQHLFNYTGSMSSFARPNALYNWMYYKVPGAKYESTGSGDNVSATMMDAYLIDPATGQISANAIKLYDVDDWRNLAYKNQFREEYTISASGGGDKIDYYISGGYLHDPSYITNSNFERYNIRSNVISQVTIWLKAGLNASYSHRTTRLQNGRFSSRNPGAAVQNVFRWTDGYNPLASIYQRDEDGNLIYDENGNKQVVHYLGQQYSPL
jgi:TonB-linked SusC/RagA family outer membrane protein